MHTLNNWKSLEDILSQDSIVLSEYIQTCETKALHLENSDSSLHLNKDVKCELAVFNNNSLLPFFSLIYFGEDLNWSLMFCLHIKALCKISCSKHDVSHYWGNWLARMECWCKNTANSSPFSFILHSLVLCTSLVLQCSICLIDSILNDAMRIVTICLCSTPMDYLPILQVSASWAPLTRSNSLFWHTIVQRSPICGPRTTGGPWKYLGDPWKKMGHYLYSMNIQNKKKINKTYHRLQFFKQLLLAKFLRNEWLYYAFSSSCIITLALTMRSRSL